MSKDLIETKKITDIDIEMRLYFHICYKIKIHMIFCRKCVKRQKKRYGA